jgi:hypothetical protein
MSMFETAEEGDLVIALIDLILDLALVFYHAL